MGNEQAVQAVNFWSDLFHLTEDYNENESGNSILEKLDTILTLIRTNDHSLINSLNKKTRVIKNPKKSL